VKIEGRSVLVTGASSGIGAATAKAVARRGGRPILLARTKSKLDELVEEIRSEAGEAHAYGVDCGDRGEVAEAASRIVEELGTPDILINNAGAGRFLFFDRTAPPEFEQMMAAPFFAALWVTRAFVPAMIERDSGHIVNVNTPIAYITWPGSAGYAMSRWAVRGLSDALRLDLHGTNVKVTQVVPGKVSSEYFQHNPGAEETIPKVSRLIRTLSPERTAEVIIRATERDKRNVFAPIELRLFVEQARFFPRLTERILIRTGRSRADGATTGEPGSGLESPAQ
jgi:short-subunit dehydrogenase